MREFILILTAVIIIALVAVVFAVMYINHNRHRKSHKPTIIYYKAKDNDREEENHDTTLQN